MCAFLPRAESLVYLWEAGLLSAVKVIFPCAPETWAFSAARFLCTSFIVF